ncbi:MAG: TRAP transporter small permease [Corticimicrobacter sp.]|uniref:TRAP transporter small permease subunit n=1 Tax=Corticimicrobacter sp. TaxID=2678536 RepID=UPI0032DAD361
MDNHSPLMRLCGKAGDAAALACGLLILAASIVITLEIMARNLFGMSFNGADELSGYALAITSTWALSATLLARRHIRIDSLYAILPRPVQLTLDVLSIVAMLAFFGLVLRYGWVMVDRSLTINAKSMTPLGTPLAIPQILWLAGLALFCLIAAILLCKALGRLLRRDWNGARQLISNRSTLEEVHEELEDAASRDGQARHAKESP